MIQGRHETFLGLCFSVVRGTWLENKASYSGRIASGSHRANKSPKETGATENGQNQYLLNQ